MIEDGDVSFVVQGPVHSKAEGETEGVTARACASIRHYFPRAEIILSTWEGAQVAECNKYVDKIIFSKDPGVVGGGSAGNKFINVNRQIVSTRAGLVAANRVYAVKTRTDVSFESNSFLRWYSDLSALSGDANYFSQKVLVTTANCLDVIRYPAPFHVGEYFYFGKCDDLKLLWDVGLAPDVYAIWRDIYPMGFGCKVLQEKCTAEQYLITAFLGKIGVGSFDLKYQTDTGIRAYFYSELYIIKNLYVVPSVLLGVCLPSHLKSLDDRKGGAHRSDWAIINNLSRWPLLPFLYVLIRCPISFFKLIYLRLRKIY